MDGFDKGENLADLVGLKVTDEMPTELGGQGGNLCEGFLNPVFAEERLPGVGGTLDDLGREGFRNGHEFDRRRLASGPLAGGVAA